MYILTNKALKEREDKAWKKGNSDATKAWQKEFELQNKQNKDYKIKMLEMLEKIILSDCSDLSTKMKKQEIIDLFTRTTEELLDTIKVLKED